MFSTRLNSWPIHYHYIRGVGECKRHIFSRDFLLILNLTLCLALKSVLQLSVRDLDVVIAEQANVTKYLLIIPTLFLKEREH